MKFVNPKCTHCGHYLKITKLSGNWLCKKCNTMFERGHDSGKNWGHRGKELK